MLTSPSRRSWPWSRLQKQKLDCGEVCVLCVSLYSHTAYAPESWVLLIFLFGLQVHPKVLWMESPLQSRTTSAQNKSRPHVLPGCFKVRWNLWDRWRVSYVLMITHRYLCYRLHPTLQCYSGAEAFRPRGCPHGEDQHGWVCYGVRPLFSLKET